MPIKHSVCVPTPPRIYNCEASIENILDNKNLSTSSFIPQLKFRVEYDLSAKIATLFFDQNDNDIIHLKSLRLQYEFGDIQIPDNLVKCISSSRIYQFPLQAVDRHVFYNGFKCSAAICDKDLTMDMSFKIPYFTTKSDIQLDFLGSYFPSENIINIFNHHLKDHPELKETERTLLKDLLNNRLDKLMALKMAIFVEDLTQQESLSIFTMLDVQLQTGKKKELCITAKNTTLPPNTDQISLCLIPMNKFNKESSSINYESECIFAYIGEIIKGVEASTIKIANPAKFDHKTNTYRDKFDISSTYAVRFIPNRITHRASLHAIEKIRENELEDFFENFQRAPAHQRKTYRKGYLKTDDFKWSNVKCNMQQKIAIKNIVNCSAFPFPYCVFGPPGTGKTSCLVECIVQIMLTKPGSKILVTAQSNSACDEIGERLLKSTSNINIFRLYSPSLLKTKDLLNKRLTPISNLRNLVKDVFPSQEELQHFQVIICTITSSSKLDRAHLYRHFDYIFIDECAATTEPEVLIPILGLGCFNRGVFSNIVLIGDHKQLPPVITSTFAKNLGLGVSLMERMMKTDRYKPNPDYDNRFVVQLLDNYRSHPAILHFSNVEFYDSKLRAKNSSAEVMLGTKWHELPNKDFPIIFHCNKTSSKIFQNGTSSYNDGEAYAVKKYVQSLLKFGIGYRKIEASDIGVVTPYKGQGIKLKQMLPQGIEIGTSEYFQGREKLIIIISTVKSNTGIGFLKDERRLNVCLTRAKSLLIVVGNPYTLQKDELWKRFIYYCKANNACKGSTFVLKRLKQNKLKEITQHKRSPEIKVQKNLEKVVDDDSSQKTSDAILIKIQECNPDGGDVLIESADIKSVEENQDHETEESSASEYFSSSDSSLVTSMASLKLDVSLKCIEDATPLNDSMASWFTPPPSPPA